MRSYLIIILLALFVGLAGGYGVVTYLRAPASTPATTVTNPAATTTQSVTSSSSVSVPMPSGGTLNLSGRDLTSVPNSVFKDVTITTLNLSHNQLTGALPAEVRHLQQLRSLDLSHNHFTGVPAEIGQLSHLEYLNLSNNPITGLPYELGNLQQLKVLDLRNTLYSQHDLNIIMQKLPGDVVIYR